MPSDALMHLGAEGGAARIIPVAVKSNIQVLRPARSHGPSAPRLLNESLCVVIRAGRRLSLKTAPAAIYSPGQTAIQATFQFEVGPPVTARRQRPCRCQCQPPSDSTARN